MRHGQRLLGVELHAERPGEAASFYAWLLGPVSGLEPTDWGPVSLLFEHAVCGVAAVEPGGPPAGWVPVIAVPDFAGVGARARAEGMRLEQRRGRTYLVDAHGVWTRVVDLASIPPDVDPDALGNTVVDLSLPDPRAAMAPYSRLLGLEQTRMLDDVTDYQLLLDDGVFALGGVWYPSPMVRLRPSWLVYFDIPDLEGTVERARRVGVKVAVPPTKEDFNIHTVLVDPFGTPFGFCTYFDIAESQMRVERADGRVQRVPDALQLLVDPRHPRPLTA